MKIINREEWGAKYGRGSAMKATPVGVVIHHTVSPAPTPGTPEDAVARAIQSIERHHVENNGWAGIGYNFLIDMDGRVWEGRGWGRIGAHAPKANATHLGVAFLMNADVADPTREAVEAVYALFRYGVKHGHLTTDSDVQLGHFGIRVKVTGHRDWAATTCPGDRLYARLDELAAQEPKLPEVKTPTKLGPPSIRPRTPVPQALLSPRTAIQRPREIEGAALTLEWAMEQARVLGFQAAEASVGKSVLDAALDALKEQVAAAVPWLVALIVKPLLDWIANRAFNQGTKGQ